MVPPRRWSARIPILALVALGAFAFALPGCGSSDDETGTVQTTVPTGSSSDQASAAAGSEVGNGGATAKSGQQGKGEEARSKRSGQKSEDSPESKKQGQRKQGSAQPDDGKSVCPKEMSRAECKRRIEATINGPQTPGKEVSDPSDCVEALGKKQCKEIVQAQKEAEKRGDNSVSPETCLDEYSREFCEERFGEQAERQAGQ
jgi:hypothetical protein